MIQFALKCDNDHRFDSWFQSADAYEKLHQTALITCAICGSNTIDKAIMAPRVRPARSSATPPVENTPDPQRGSQADNQAHSDKTDNPLTTTTRTAEQNLRQMRRAVEKSAEDVGDDFAAEARAIHHGEAKERAIIGQAKLEDAKALIEDGIPVAPLPWSSRKTN